MFETSVSMCFNVFDTFCFAPLGHLDARGRYFSPLPWSKRSNNLLEQRVWAVPRVADEVLEGDNVLRMFHVSKARLACQPVPGEFCKYGGGSCGKTVFLSLSLHYPNTLLLGSTSWSEAIFGMSRLIPPCVWERQGLRILRRQLSVPLCAHGTRGRTERTSTWCLQSWKNLSVEHAHICKVKNASATQRLASWCFWRSVSQGQWGQCVHARVPDVTCPFTKS